MRTAIILALILGATPLVWQPTSAAPDEKPATFDGKVVPIQNVIEKSGGKLDREAPRMIGLVVDGKTYLIIRDEGGRRFYKDDKLLNRDYRIRGRLIAGTLLEVLSVQSLKNGKPHDIYYWCDICAIRRNVLNECECCGGPMELREVPIEKQ